MSFFDDVNSEDHNLDVSALKKKASKPQKSTPKAALNAVAAEQGWVDRQPRKPGPKRLEPRTVLTMNGPVRVIDRFRQYAEESEMSQWKALEQLMIKAEVL